MDEAEGVSNGESSSASSVISNCWSSVSAALECCLAMEDDIEAMDQRLRW